MKRLILGIIFLCSMLAVVTVSYAIHDLKPAESQPVEDTLARQIQGTWTLVSIVNEQDGKKTDLFGPNPKGQMIMTADGHYSMIFLSANLPKFASNNRVKGTAEENQAVVQGSNAYFGRYKVVSEKEGTVSMTDEGGTFPNWDGQSWHRVMTVVGDELRVTSHKASIGSGTNYIIWKRVK